MHVPLRDREACKSILAFLKDSLELLLLGSGQQKQAQMGASAPRESDDGPSRGAGDGVLAAVDGSSSSTREAMRSAAQAAVVPRGPLLCQLLLTALTGALPESRTDDVRPLRRSDSSDARHSCLLSGGEVLLLEVGSAGVLPTAWSFTSVVERFASKALKAFLCTIFCSQVVDLLTAVLTGCGAVTLQWLQPLLAAIPGQVVSDGEKSRVMEASAVMAEVSQESTHVPRRAAREQFLSALEDLSGACRRNKRVSQLVQNALLPAFARQT